MHPEAPSEPTNYACTKPTGQYGAYCTNASACAISEKGVQTYRTSNNQPESRERTDSAQEKNRCDGFSDVKTLRPYDQGERGNRDTEHQVSHPDEPTGNVDRKHPTKRAGGLAYQATGPCGAAEGPPAWERVERIEGTSPARRG